MQQTLHPSKLSTDEFPTEIIVLNAKHIYSVIKISQIIKLSDDHQATLEYMCFVF